MVPTGCDELDGLLSGGLRKGSLNTIASVPSMGKTGFSLSLVSSMARKGIRVVFFSFEMDSEGLMDRTIRGTTITTETPRDFANKIENISFICPHEGKLKELNESISSSDADVFFVDTIQLVSCPLSKDGPYEVSVLKNRYGKTGSFEARFDEGCCFFDLAQQENHPVYV